MEEKKNILEQSASMAARLFQNLGLFIDESVKNNLHTMSDNVVQLSNQLSQVDTKQQQSIYDAQGIRKELEDISSIGKLLESTVETTRILSKEHYDQSVIQPIVRSLFPVFDLVEDTRRHRADADCKADDFLDALWSQMLQFLSVYDVDIIRHQTDDKFDAKLMKPIEKIPTTNKELDKCVAQSLQVGFSMGSQRMLRLETISLFEYQASETNITSIERNQK
ncbi:GrpE [Limihaloglobus sulfuriphilus]|uniref:GrpE n=1 Tax=Limihaloglobus sulfuriphilus TaxID=1851148 RepID=A0A1Q2MF48_9BACT|nr:nucleotide exchange factor GrpE [Limihaloglobus sulfuriphilus]AQQ70917.1 GrpE [Limihaloglobus sulfuriphilus]